MFKGRGALLSILALTLLAAVPASAQAIASREVKILGGAEAAPGQFPWMAALVDVDSRNAADGIFCGGTVVAPRVILTAGHCVQGTTADQELRRLQVAARDGRTWGALWRRPGVRGGAIAAPLRLALSRQEGRLAVRVLKRRGAELSQPVLLPMAS